MNKQFAVLGLFLFLAILPHTNGDLNSDKQALLDFATEVPHSWKLNWTSTSSICTSWVGIICNINNTRVIAVQIPGKGLIGPIPPDTLGRLDALVTLSLRSNRLGGTLPSDILSLPNLHNIFLQNNNFVGEISLVSLSPSLSAIDLSLNSFHGSIPSSFQNLTHLTLLNLQNNALSGPIPDFNSSRLIHLNLSYNHLNGTIPSSLHRFAASSFEGNTLLCGAPLKQCDSVNPSPSPLPRQSSKKKLSIKIIIAIGAGGIFLLLLFLLILFICCFKKKNREDGPSSKTKGERPEEFGSGVQSSEKNKLVYFEGCSYSFDLEDLLKASAEVLGKGTCGTTYKAILEDGTTVVVKRLKELVLEKRDFEQQMENVRKIGHHPNVVPLRAYYYSKDEKLLIYDYIAAGSFSSLLHEIGTPLDWGSRVKIALGVAKGVAHIHAAGGGAKGVAHSHGNIKSSNVLLRQDHQGCISEFGLSPMIRVVPPKHAGYLPPEVMKTQKASQKTDIYNFGVLLLEMVTGKSPVQSPGEDLPSWVQSVVREEWTAEVFDEELLQDSRNMEEELMEMLKIALACVSGMPDSRPAMEEVVKMMEDVRQDDSLIIGEIKNTFQI